MATIPPKRLTRFSTIRLSAKLVSPRFAANPMRGCAGEPFRVATQDAQVECRSGCSGGAFRCAPWWSAGPAATSRSSPGTPYGSALCGTVASTAEPCVGLCCGRRRPRRRAGIIGGARFGCQGDSGARTRRSTARGKPWQRAPPCSRDAPHLHASRPAANLQRAHEHDDDACERAACGRCMRAQFDKDMGVTYPDPRSRRATATRTALLLPPSGMHAPVNHAAPAHAMHVSPRAPGPKLAGRIAPGTTSS